MYLHFFFQIPKVAPVQDLLITIDGITLADPPSAILLQIQIIQTTLQQPAAIPSLRRQLIRGIILVSGCMGIYALQQRVIMCFG